MIANFGIHLVSLIAPIQTPPPPPPPPVVEYVASYNGVEFESGQAPDMTLATDATDGVAVDTGDGITVTDYTTVDRPVYDDAWKASLCEAKPVACYGDDWNN